MRRHAIWLGVASLLAGFVTTAALPAQAATTVSTKYLLTHLSVAAEHPSGYSPTKFKLWIDIDHDGCNTRYEVLIAEAVKKPRVGAHCSLTGGRWISPYDGATTTSPSKLDIDHLVPLAEAWQSGAWVWNADTRTRYANDLGYGPDLVAVSTHANRAKGEREPQQYLPPRKAFDCTYMAWWVAVKWRWHLSVDGKEKSFLTTRLTACKWPKVQQPSRPNIGRNSPTPAPPPTPTPSTVRISSIYFDSPGSDDGSNASLNAEWVAVTNGTAASADLTGWTLSDADSHVYTFPSAFSLPAGGTVTVHTGSGTNTATDLYWGSGSYIWNNTGDTATLSNGPSVVSTCSYTSSQAPQATC